MSRRARGDGGLRKRNNGLWEGRVTLANGKRRSIYGRSRERVATELRELVRAAENGAVPDRSAVGEYLASWLTGVQPSLRPTTWRRYRQLIEIHAIPAIGSIPLKKLTPDHLQALYSERLRAGAAPASVLHLHAVISRALNQALRKGYLLRNVATLVDRPRVPRQEVKAFTAEQARCLLRASDDDRLHALYVVALNCGLRQGEILALTWGAVDLDGGSLQVTATLQRGENGFEFREPKTSASRRRVQLNQPTIEALRAHRRRQAEERLRLGPAWSDNDLVFANQVGNPIEAQNLVRRNYYPLLDSAGLPRLPFHSLRHTCASLALERGVNVKVVSELLGHASPTVTLTVYAHTTLGMHAAASDAIAQALAQ